jgi:fructokinase
MRITGMPYTIVGLGEVLWDLFPEGAQFGGAPANFACHAAMLGADAFVVSRVGDDELGERAIAALRQHGVETRHVGRSRDHATGTVRVELDDAGRPRFEISGDAAWDHVPWSEDLEDLARRTDAVCFGTLAQRADGSRGTIRRFLRATGPDCLRIFDANLRRPFFDDRVVLDSLRLADALKLNDEELPVLASWCGLGGSPRDVLEGLRERYGLRLVALTRGAEGAMLLGDDGLVECPGTPVDVKDTVGAGDAFTAAMALGWLEGRGLDVVCRHACRVAAFVCSQAGGTPQLPGALTGDPDSPSRGDRT